MNFQVISPGKRLWPLVPRPRKRVMHFAARLFSGEGTPDGDTVTICASIPGFGLTAQRGDLPDPSPSHTLGAEKADFNLSLVQPASVRGSAVHGEAIP